ncbi:MAG: hypothetical protein ACOCXY_00785 [Planctomycetota bacterium]
MAKEESVNNTIEIDAIPGARKQNIQWMICCGVSTPERAKEIGASFAEDLKRLRSQLNKAKPRGQ